MINLTDILRTAVEAGASDVHIKADAPVVFRIARELTPSDLVATPEWVAEVASRLLPRHLRDMWDEQVNADFAYDEPDVGRFRINLYQHRGQPAMSIRLVRAEVPGFAELNLPPMVQRAAESPRGLVLVAGPTGCGKSTTLAAIIEHINRTARRHIITFEDPVEFTFVEKLSRIEQREIGIDTPTFASGLRHVLRQDPDVIMVGEMRDAESAETAIRASTIGHLVLATLHTADAAKSVRRILEFFPAAEREQPRRQLAESLRAVFCQRLVRSVEGGLLPAVEILVNTGAVAKLIDGDQFERIPAAIELGAGDGMRTLETALLELVHSKRVAPEEALRHALNPEALSMRLQGVTLQESTRILGAR
jgi:twitching motility protein PilT